MKSTIAADNIIQTFCAEISTCVPFFQACPKRAVIYPAPVKPPDQYSVSYVSDSEELSCR